MFPTFLASYPQYRGTNHYNYAFGHLREKGAKRLVWFRWGIDLEKLCSLPRIFSILVSLESSNSTSEVENFMT